MNTYFCDGIAQVTLINGVARVEFFRLQNTNAAEPAADAPVELTLAVPAYIVSIYTTDISRRHIRAETTRRKEHIHDARTGCPGAPQGALDARLPAQEAPGGHAGGLLAGVVRVALPRPATAAA